MFVIIMVQCQEREMDDTLVMFTKQRRICPELLH
jgi:hypothetical protein